jgi:hypothetical protein
MQPIAFLSPALAVAVTLLPSLASAHVGEGVHLHPIMNSALVLASVGMGIGVLGLRAIANRS